jgi:hypothetical protein
MTYLIYDTALNGHYTLLLLQGRYPVSCCLFTGTKDGALFDVAPYLFQIDDSFYELDKLPMVSLEAIILVETDKDIKTLATHFREFIYRNVGGEEYYFRFWDGRVLKNYLPKCEPEQLYYFFGNASSFKTDGTDAGSSMVFDIHKEKLRIKESAPIFKAQDEAMQENGPAGTPEEKPQRRRFIY